MNLINSQINKSIINTFLLVIVYASAFYMLQIFLFKIGMLSVLPDEHNIAVFDANWYYSIKHEGYKYGSGGSNSGFYILLPWVWELLHVGSWGMSIANIIFFASGFTILCSLLDSIGNSKITTIDKILWLSIPTVFYAFIPYAEALYFLLSTTALYGICFNKRWLIWISLILLSLTRATAVLLLPAFLFMNLVSAEPKYWFRSFIHYIVNYATPIIIGTWMFILYQYKTTGVWFAYYKQQHDHWSREFSWPAFPLNSTEGNRTVWLGALAIFVCILALICVIIFFYKWIVEKNVAKNKLLALSTFYLTMTLITIIFFNPKWSPGNCNTNIMGAHRYGLMNPFFYVLLYQFTKEKEYTLQQYFGVFLLANAVWLLFGSYTHLQFFLFFTIDSIIVLLYMLSSNKRLMWPIICLITLNFFIQIHLFQQFMALVYVD